MNVSEIPGNRKDVDIVTVQRCDVVDMNASGPRVHSMAADGVRTDLHIFENKYPQVNKK